MVRLLSSFTEVHRDSKGSSPDFCTYFPHPSHWKLYSGDRKLKVSSQAARIILANYKKYGEESIATFSDLLTDLQACL